LNKTLDRYKTRTPRGSKRNSSINKYLNIINMERIEIPKTSR